MPLSAKHHPPVVPSRQAHTASLPHPLGPEAPVVPALSARCPNRLSGLEVRAGSIAVALVWTETLRPYFLEVLIC
jgi:hypothetical protein